MKIVTSYKEPDLDGVSCMYAYSELLNKQSEISRYFIWNDPKQEVKIVCDIFNINLNSINLDEVTDENEYVLVDVNGKDQINEKIRTDKVVEIIDHHGLNKCLHEYSEVKRLQIDRVGAAATIVAERYKMSGLIPSRESAILLFYGIISNSINLKSNITNKRDIDACDWLKSVCADISDEKIKDIFIKKSYIDDCNLRSEMECEIPNVFENFKTIVAQLEVANLEEFLINKKQKILEIMQCVKKEKHIDFIFINCVDILNGYTIIFGADDDSNKFVEKTYGFKFSTDGIFKADKVIQRKELTASLRRKYMEKKHEKI